MFPRMWACEAPSYEVRRARTCDQTCPMYCTDISSESREYNLTCTIQPQLHGTVHIVHTIIKHDGVLIRTSLYS